MCLVKLVCASKGKGKELFTHLSCGGVNSPGFGDEVVLWLAILSIHNWVSSCGVTQWEDIVLHTHKSLQAKVQENNITQHLTRFAHIYEARYNQPKVIMYHWKLCRQLKLSVHLCKSWFQTDREPMMQSESKYFSIADRFITWQTLQVICLYFIIIKWQVVYWLKV